MSATIAEYLLQIALNSGLTDGSQWRDDAARTSMDAAVLSRQQQDVILSRDANRIRKAIEAELSPAAEVTGTSMPMFMIVPLR